MKDCYFFWPDPDDHIIYVDHKRGEPIILDSRRCSFTHSGNGELYSIQDLETGKYYYPAADCKGIQF